MSYFAYVPSIVEGKGVVENVIRITQDVLDSGMWGNPVDWYQTSYNTRGNIHYGPDGKPDGGIPLRANYAGIGDIYDQVNDVFYTQQPYPSWELSTQTWIWIPPIPYPTDNNIYEWDEATLSWKQIDNG